MTKAEEQTLRNCIARLQCTPMTVNGKPWQGESDEVHAALTDHNVKLYLDTWVTGALQLLLPESHNP